MHYKVVFTPEAEEQLAELYRYIAMSASPARAAHFTSAIVDYCESLEKFSLRGNRRDDIRPGLRSRIRGSRSELMRSFNLIHKLR